MNRRRGLVLAGLLIGWAGPLVAQSGTVTVDTILVRARRWLGPAALERVRTLRAVAEVDGPQGHLRTVIRSRIDGRMRFEQFDSSSDGNNSAKFIAGIGRNGAWEWSVDKGEGVPLDPKFASGIVGHEFHLLAAYPTSRWSSPRLIGRELAEGDSVWRVDFKDPMGSRVSIRYATDGRPVDLSLVNHSGQGSPLVRVRLFDWPESSDSARLFRRAVILHGTQTWLYRYVSLESDPSPDAAFEPSAPIDAPVPPDSGTGSS